MDELTISGKKYISSKRAAEISGYAKDYIGQLARAQKIKATRVGRTWYVLEEALLGHKNENSSSISESIINHPNPRLAVQKTLYSHRQITDIPKTWSTVRYYSDQGAPLLPALINQKTATNEDIRTINKNIDNSDVIKKIKITHPSKITIVRTSREFPEPNNNVVGDEIIAPKNLPNPHVKTTGIALERRNLNLITYAPHALVAVLAIAIIVPLSGLFLGSELRFGSGAPERAVAAVGFENFSGIFDAGLSTFFSFYHALIDSFGLFFQNGLTFIVDLLSRLSEIIFR